MDGLIVLPEDVRAEKRRRQSGRGVWTVGLTMLALLAILGLALAVGLRLLGG